MVGEQHCHCYLGNPSHGTGTATPDLIHQAQFALDTKAQVLPLYEKVFDIEYQLPKLDTLVVSHFARSTLLSMLSDAHRENEGARL